MERKDWSDLVQQLKKLDVKASVENQNRWHELVRTLMDNVRSLSEQDVLGLFPALGMKDREVVTAVVIEKFPSLSTKYLIQLGAYDLKFVELVIGERYAKLSDSEWNLLAEYLKTSPLEWKKSCLNYLSEKKEHLSHLGLIWLGYLGALAAPQAFVDIYTLVLQNELNRVKQKESNVVISLPTTVRCNPSSPVSMKSRSPDEPLHFLNRTGNTVSLDLYGDSLFQVDPLAPSLTLSLSSFLAEGTSIRFSVMSLPAGPVVHLDTFYSLHSDRPSVSIPLPLSISVPYGTIGVRLSGSIVKTSTMAPSSPQPASSVRGSFNDGLIVCNGEVHKFSVRPEETMRDILKRASKRWRLVATDFQLEDADFAPIPEERTFADFMKQGSNILRLAQKPKGINVPFGVQPAKTIGNTSPFAQAPPTGGFNFNAGPVQQGLPPPGNFNFPKESPSPTPTSKFGPPPPPGGFNIFAPEQPFQFPQVPRTNFFDAPTSPTSRFGPPPPPGGF